MPTTLAENLSKAILAGIEEPIDGLRIITIHNREIALRILSTSIDYIINRSRGEVARPVSGGDN